MNNELEKANEIIYFLFSSACMRIQSGKKIKLPVKSSDIKYDHKNDPDYMNAQEWLLKYKLIKKEQCVKELK